MEWVHIHMYYSKFKVVFKTLLLIFFFTVTIEAKQVNVLAITEDFASIAKSIGGKHVTVETLIKGSRNLHEIAPKPSMVLKFRSADLIIRLGLKQDTWIDGLIDVARKKNLFPGQKGYLDASTGIPLLEIPTGKIDGRQGDVHKFGNPHYWLNPENGLIIADNICEKLILLDPSNKDEYKKNLYIFKKDLKRNISTWKKEAKVLSQAKIITYHKVWSYLIDFLKLEDIGNLEPIPGIPPTTKHLLKLKNMTKNETGMLILTANYYPKDIGRKFADQTNSKFFHLPAHVGEAGISSYSELFDYLISRLTK